MWLRVIQLQHTAPSDSVLFPPPPVSKLQIHCTPPFVFNWDHHPSLSLSLLLLLLLLLCQSWWIRSCDCLVRPLEHLLLWDCSVSVCCVWCVCPCVCFGSQSWLDWIAFTGSRTGQMNKAPSVRPSPSTPAQFRHKLPGRVCCLL